MVEHRRTPSRRAYVLPGWFLTVTAGACVAGVLGLGWVVFLAPDPDPATASSSATTTTPSPTPTRTATPTPSETATTEKPKPKPSPTVGRDDIQVTVLNATRTAGLARQVSAQVSAAGWTVASIGNWRNPAAQTAVHFPGGRKDEARLLASDLGVSAVLPSVNGMRTDRLTVILLGLP